MKYYKEGKNWWRDNRYHFMSKMNLESGITEFGSANSKGSPYYHILSPADQKNKLHNFIGEQEIYNHVIERFKTKAGDLKRVLTNTVASQPCCFNLFTPLRNRLPLASKLFSHLLQKEITVSELIIEFTPGQYNGSDETIGDQSAQGGTDSDVAVFYTTADSKKGVLLIEFKYIEYEFSVCSSYKNKNISDICDTPDFYKKLIAPNINSSAKQFDCGYLKYQNWRLLEDSAAFNADKIKTANRCPFRFSLNQLWRNMLLAEKVAKARHLDEFGFWVINPKENSFALQNSGENVKDEFLNILSDKGKSLFKVLELDNDVVKPLEQLSTEEWTDEWLRKFRQRYLTNTDFH